ncbi:hypothetical protein K488DRAFT_89762 [Vararia minispora EC-137]|uniref:Uncharacterized protein n=1 Tax=Vararia minispora EC-137 TaxID=1314806 RepID=A0ACB8Q9B2_9AGAM|nr:hypothetical protein K488DRAFT_89762 [Vararia minispora EC-137]
MSVAPPESPPTRSRTSGLETPPQTQSGASGARPQTADAQQRQRQQQQQQRRQQQQQQQQPQPQQPQPQQRQQQPQPQQHQLQQQQQPQAAQRQLPPPPERPDAGQPARPGAQPQSAPPPPLRTPPQPPAAPDTPRDCGSAGSLTPLVASDATIEQARVAAQAARKRAPLKPVQPGHVGRPTDVGEPALLPVPREPRSRVPTRPRRRASRWPAPLCLPFFPSRPAPVTAPRSPLAVPARRWSIAPPPTQLGGGAALPGKPSFVPAKIHSAIQVWDYFSYTHASPRGAARLEDLLPSLRYSSPPDVRHQRLLVVLECASLVSLQGGFAALGWLGTTTPRATYGFDYVSPIVLWTVMDEDTGDATFDFPRMGYRTHEKLSVTRTIANGSGAGLGWRSTLGVRMHIENTLTGDVEIPSCSVFSLLVLYGLDSRADTPSSWCPAIKPASSSTFQVSVLSENHKPQQYDLAGDESGVFCVNTWLSCGATAIGSCAPSTPVRQWYGHGGTKLGRVQDRRRQVKRHRAWAAASGY